MMYYNSSILKSCIDRRVPPPSKLYWWARAVFAMFGHQKDAKSGKSLFNTNAWTKVKNVLAEMLKGNALDPSGVFFYMQQLDNNGNVLKNKYGMELLTCNRGTNDTENYHKQIVIMHNAWTTRIHMSDCLLDNHDHCLNNNCFKRKHFNFPQVGHYDTWLIDLLQLLVQRNHGILLYPD